MYSIGLGYTGSSVCLESTSLEHFQVVQSHKGIPSFRTSRILRDAVKELNARSMGHSLEHDLGAQVLNMPQNISQHV